MSSEFRTILKGGIIDSAHKARQNKNQPSNLDALISRL